MLLGRAFDFYGGEGRGECMREKTKQPISRPRMYLTA
uniref:Uncharacterized protein n=1 Tax=Myoviridae sp. ctfrL10 TaxID=2826678 RepID=A0A8S5MS27_9CAUD|nr:MAG TPA: hypothetical protein [Myoviridae sp. ctfrL10]